MTVAEKLHQLIQTLPENQINEALNLAEFLHPKQLSSAQTIPPTTSPDHEASPNGLGQLLAIGNCNQNTPTI
jgi:hypothetical protein